jgi:hypothetical protein
MTSSRCPTKPVRTAECRTPALSVVAPCYNEADGLYELHRRLTAACRQVVGGGKARRSLRN